MFLNALMDLDVTEPIKHINHCVKRNDDDLEESSENSGYDNTKCVTNYCCESSDTYDSDDSRTPRESCYSFTKDNNQTQTRLPIESVFAHIGVIMDYCKDTLKNRVNGDDEAVYECFSGVSFYIDRVMKNKTGIFPISQDTISRDVIHNMYTIYNFSDNVLNYLLYVSSDKIIDDIRKELEERIKHCEHCVSNKTYKHEFYFSYPDQLDHINSSMNKLKTLLTVI